MSPNMFLNESMTGVKFAPDVTAEDKVSLIIFTITNPGSLVTVSLKNDAGIATALVTKSVPIPPKPSRL